jgi:transcriptional regulator with XRE-family HTH domain
MNATFPRVISLLRREKKLSQKQAAADLGISQALLSHYEKGIRECGLDFVVRIADYYDVSSDYLLGRSADRSGLILCAEEVPALDSSGKQSAQGPTGLLPLLHRKLVTNSLGILYDLVSHTKNRALLNEISVFMMLSVYRMFRIVYTTDSSNAQAMFSLPGRLAHGYADAAMRTAETNAAAIARGDGKHIPSLEECEPVTPISLSSKGLAQSYPMFASSLFNLIKNSEDHIQRQNGRK